MDTRNWEIDNKSVYERLEYYGFEESEIDEALEHLLFDHEKTFLANLYPLGLKSSHTIYDFEALIRPVYEMPYNEYWKLAQMVLDTYKDELSKWGSLEFPSFNDSKISVFEMRQIQLLFRLRNLCDQYELMYRRFIGKDNDYIKINTVLKEILCKIVGDNPLSQLLPNCLGYSKEKKEAQNRLFNIISTLKGVIEDCRQKKEAIRFNAKKGEKYLMRYNPQPFVNGKRRKEIAKVRKAKIKRYLNLQHPLSISTEDVQLFRQLLQDSSLNPFLKDKITSFQEDAKLDPYTITSLWISPETIRGHFNLGEIKLETIGAYLKESISIVLTDLQSGRIMNVLLRAYKPHRPETLRYLASKVKSFPLDTQGYPCVMSPISYDKFYILLNLKNPQVFGQLPWVEQQFVVLKFGLRGKFYSCETIAKMLHVDLNLIKNYYAKYLRLIFKAMESYAHQYIDMEAEAKVVLK